MKKSRILILCLLLGCMLGLVTAVTVALTPPTQAYTPQELLLLGEKLGAVASERPLADACTFAPEYQLYLCEETRAPLPTNAGMKAAARALLLEGNALLVPESSNDTVMVLDKTTGDLVDPAFISDTINLSTPINAILSAGGDSILVSDQIEDAVFEYDLDGNFIGLFAPAGGPNPDILNNVRGIALRENGNLLVTVASGANSNAIAEFDTAGNYLGNFVAIGSGGLNSPFDAFGRDADWLVGGINSDAIHRYDLSGTYLDDLAPLNSFPEQVQGAANDNILIGNFNGTQEGIVELLPDGTLVGVYDPVELGGYRGVYELPNNNILVTTGSGVHEIDRSGNLIETKVSDVSARFIESAGAASISLQKTVGTSATGCATTDNIIVDAGTEVTYCFEVTNTGVFTLTTHDLVDSHVGTVLSGLNYNLVPGASVYVTGSVNITQTTVSSATWTATDNISYTVAATDTTWVTLALYGVDVGADPDPLIGEPGETVTHTVWVTNTGNVTDTYTLAAAGETWVTAVDPPTVTLPAAGVTAVAVSVMIPPGAGDGDMDMVTISATSTNATDSVVLTTMAFIPPVYMVDLAADPDMLSGGPDETVTYTVWVTNTGNVTDTFAFTAEDETWLTTLSPLSATLASAQGMPVTVWVTIPTDAMNDDMDVVNVTATSANTSNSLPLTTTAVVPPVYMVDLAAAPDMLSGGPGETVTYTVWVTNTGNVTDTYTLTAEDEVWLTTLSPVSATLAAGQGLTVTVWVTVPADVMNNDMDTVNITATSTNTSNAVPLTTTAVVVESDWIVYLPVITNEE